MADYRPSEIYFNDIHLPLPIFFPSISSLKTNLKVFAKTQYINVLQKEIKYHILCVNVGISACKFSIYRC